PSWPLCVVRWLRRSTDQRCAPTAASSVPLLERSCFSGAVHAEVEARFEAAPHAPLRSRLGLGRRIGAAHWRRRIGWADWGGALGRLQDSARAIAGAAADAPLLAGIVGRVDGNFTEAFVGVGFR